VLVASHPPVMQPELVSGVAMVFWMLEKVAIPSFLNIVAQIVLDVTVGSSQTVLAGVTLVVMV